MRVTTVIAGLGGGGAERVCVNLANAWAARGWEVTILTTSQGKAIPAYEIDPNVQKKDLRWPRRADPYELNEDLIMPVLRGIWGVACFEIVYELAFLTTLRYAILATTPNVVVAHIDYTNVRVLAAMHDTGIPVIVCEHTDTRRFTIGAWQRTREALYRRANAVVASHPDIAEWLKRRGAKAYAIPNPLKEPPQFSGEKTGPRRRLVTLTRLSPEKRVDLMIRAFARIAADFPDWDLEIYGTGPTQYSVETLIRQLAPDRIKLRGFTNDPYGMLASADLFVSASWVEGFGNAIWEALACGVPVVAMDAGAPVCSLVRHGVDGLIVWGDSPELAAALASLMSDDKRREAFAARAPEVMTRFSFESSLRAWEALLIANCGLRNANC
jgi:GalNAc-alpha-(1->4)-GalNAc-alpha-(1->3)-diNAcBac-PP-undecaprenol alpha-1,4-N-acetyl-D-galactosaminyltransferase